MLRLYSLVALTFVLFSIPVFHARGQEDIAQAEVDGLVLDRTLTRLGHDFFREYVALLGVEDGVPGFTLTIREKVSAQWGSVIAVEANDQMVFQSPLRPRGERVGEIAEKAVRATADFLVHSSGNGLRSDHEDLSDDGY